MLLIFLSSAWFSLLRGSLGSLRFFSLGTSDARGWRCPIGASGILPLMVSPVDIFLLFPVCAMAVPPSKARIDSDTTNFLILLLHSRYCGEPAADVPHFSSS